MRERVSAGLFVAVLIAALAAGSLTTASVQRGVRPAASLVDDDDHSVFDAPGCGPDLVCALDAAPGARSLISWRADLSRNNDRLPQAEPRLAVAPKTSPPGLCVSSSI